MNPRYSPLAQILGAQFRSGNAEQIKAAVKNLRPHVAEHGGNLSRMADALGISRRSLIRWAEQCPALAELIEAARCK